MSIIKAENISFTYSQGTSLEKTAVDNVSFSIEKGELVGVIGHTGSGKSTLVQLLNGLLKPTSGKIFFNGNDIWAEPKKIRSLRFNVGMVFQYPEYQLFEETVYKDVAFGPANMGLSQDEIEQKVLNAIRFVGLKENILSKSPFDLSGGEKRRVAIAGVIAMDPQVLILDEPTAGLDPHGRDVLLSQILDYHKTKNNSVILVSHNMEDIAQNANRTMVLSDSKLVMLDDTAKIFSRVNELEQIGLQVPQITKIMSLLREQGFPVSKSVLTVQQALKEIVNLTKGADPFL
ncbi:MAG: energy-coupling factor transporter ATPase [Clostridia bacterium]|nr:energy-coupling factor transporter ATPase [Clostridia bacterium]